MTNDHDDRNRSAATGALATANAKCRRHAQTKTKSVGTQLHPYAGPGIGMPIPDQELCRVRCAGRRCSRTSRPSSALGSPA
jgi:hypothetical protein